jgi:hypothetical protein
MANRSSRLSISEGVFLYLRLKMARQGSCSKEKKRRTSPPSTPFVVGGIDFSLWARQLQKTKKEKKMMMIIII